MNALKSVRLERRCSLFLTKETDKRIFKFYIPIFISCNIHVKTGFYNVYIYQPHKVNF